MSASDSTRLGHASPLIKARVAAKDPIRVTGFVEQTTLFVVALKKTNALELLDGLTEPARRTARLFAQRLADLDSPTRQARVALEFGVRDDARDRLKAMIDDAPPALRAALEAALPSAWRQNRAAAPPPGSAVLKALATRLVREAMR